MKKKPHNTALQPTRKNGLLFLRSGLARAAEFFVGVNKMRIHILGCIVFILLHQVCFGNDDVARNKKSNEVENLILQGKKYCEENNPSKALSIFEKALSLDYSNAKSHAGIASTYARLKKYDKALEEFRIAMKLDAKLKESIIPLMVGILLFREDFDGLKGCVREAREKDPRLNRAISHAITVVRTFGIIETDDGFEVQPQDPFAWSKEFEQVVLEAYSHQKNKQVGKAVQALERYIDDKKTPDDQKALAYYHTGRISHALGDSMIGISGLLKAIEIVPNYAPWRQELVMMLLPTQLYTIALKETEQLLKLSPTDKYALLSQGIIYNEFGWYRKAVKRWDELKVQDKFLFLVIEDVYERAAAYSKDAKN